MTLLVNSFEGGTPGTAITTGNSGGTSGNTFDGVNAVAGATPAYDNTHGAAHGSVSCLISDTTAGTPQCWWAASMGTQSQVWFRVNLYFAALPAAGQIRVFYAGGGTNGVYCAILNGGVNMIQSNGVGITTSVTKIPVGQWFRLEGYVLGSSGSTGQCEVRLFQSLDAVDPVETNTSAATLTTQAALNGYFYGVSISTPNVQYWMDDVALSNTGYIGPVIPAPILLQNSFEGGTNGASTTTGNSSAPSGNQFDAVPIASGGTLQYSNAQAAHGSLSALVQCGTTTGVACEWTASAATQSLTAPYQAKVWFRLYMYFASLPAANTGFFTVANGGGTGCARFWVTTAGNLLVQDGTGTQITLSAAAVPVGAWFRVEGFTVLSATAGQTEIRLFTAVDGTTPAEINTSAATQNTLGSATTYAFGIYGGTANQGPYWVDDLGLSNTGYLGPVVYPIYTQPGTTAPPGFASPASFGFQDGPFGGFPANDAPVPNAPYVIAASPVTAGTGTTAKVTQRTGPGDTIVVFAGALNVLGIATTCTDSRGNVYGQPATANGNNCRAGRFICVNPVPLQPGDTITITWASSNVHQGLIAVGLPGAYLGQPGANLILDASSGATSSTASISTATISQASASEVALAWIGTYSTAASGVINWPVPWNVLADTTDGTAEFSAGWIPVTSKLAIPLRFSFNSAVSGSGALITSFMPETRFAQPNPRADTPPGWLSPGAWQYQPGFVPGMSVSTSVAPAALTIPAASQPAVTVSAGSTVYLAAAAVTSPRTLCAVPGIMMPGTIWPGAMATAASEFTPRVSQPAVMASASSAAAPAALAVTVTQPAVTAGLPATPAMLTASITQPAVAASASSTAAQATGAALSDEAGNALLDESGGTLLSEGQALAPAASFPAPTAGAGAGPPPGLKTVTAAFPAAAASAGSAPAPAALAVTTQTAVTASASSAVSPAALAATVSQPAAAASASSAAARAALAATVSQPAAAAAGNTAIFPVAVAVTSATPSPAASAGSAATPGTAAVLAAIATPAVQQDRSVAVTAIAAAAAVPGATAGAGAGPPPGLLLVPAAFPAAAASASSSVPVSVTVPGTFWMSAASYISALYAIDPATTATFFSSPLCFSVSTSQSGPGSLPAGFTTTPALKYIAYGQLLADITGTSQTISGITYIPVAISPAYKWVMYDIEDWSTNPPTGFTSAAAQAEIDNPWVYMADFTTLAHASGYKVILAPGRDLGNDPTSVNPLGVQTLDQWYISTNLAGTAASAGAEIVHIQAQADQGAAEFGIFWASAYAQVRAAPGGSGVIVSAGVSTTSPPGIAATAMAASAQSVLGQAAGFWLNTSTGSSPTITTADAFLLLLLAGQGVTVLQVTVTLPAANVIKQIFASQGSSTVASVSPQASAQVTVS